MDREVSCNYIFINRGIWHGKLSRRNLHVNWWKISNLSTVCQSLTDQRKLVLHLKLIVISDLRRLGNDGNDQDLETTLNSQQRHHLVRNQAVLSVKEPAGSLQVCRSLVAWLMERYWHKQLFELFWCLLRSRSRSHIDNMISLKWKFLHCVCREWTKEKLALT